MGYINRSFKNVLNIGIYAVIFMVGLYLFMNLIPYVIMLGLVGWVIFKAIKIFKSWKMRKNDVITTMENTTENFSNGEIIDVEYKEI